MKDLLFWFVLSVLAATSRAEGEAPNNKSNRYRLISRDVIHIAVQGEPTVDVQRRLDSQGEISAPLLGQIRLAGLTVSEAQALLTKRYVSEEIFVRPEISLEVVEYTPREIMVLGQVTKQGKQVLPPEATNISIVEAITSAGGLTRIAKGDAVRVTRKNAADAEESFTVDVEKLINGRGGDRQRFLLEPGDVVFVPERTF